MSISHRRLNSNSSHSSSNSELSSSSFSFDPSCSRKPVPSLSLTVCTTLLTLSLLSPSVSISVSASPAGSPLPSPVPSFLSSVSSAGSPALEGLNSPRLDLGVETSGSGSGSGSAWGSSAGPGSVWPSDSPSTAHTSLSRTPALHLVSDSGTGHDLAGLGLGLGIEVGSSSVIEGLGSGNLITRRRASVTDRTAGKQLGAETITSDGREDTATSTGFSGGSSWFSAVWRYFTPTAPKSMSPVALSGQDDKAGQRILWEPTRPGRASSRKMRRRRGGDEQDIAGLGKSRGRRVGRQEAVAWTENNTNTTTSNGTTTTNHLAIPLPPAPSSAVPLNTSFPLPLDSTLSYSLGNSCVAFLTGFLTSDEMAGKDGEEGRCKPFGLLHGSSSGWAGMLRSPEELNSALSQVCHPSSTAQADECSAFFQQSYTDMIKAGNCRQELQQGNTVALSVYRGLQYYEMMQRAACLQDEGTGPYCYLEAMSADRPDDAYLWSIPGGNTLPTTTKPTCSSCSKSLLDLYATSPAVKHSSEISESAYGPSFRDTITDVLLLLTDRCGAGFLDVKIASAATSGAAGRSGVGSASLSVGLLASFIIALTMAI